MPLDSIGVEPAGDRQRALPQALAAVRRCRCRARALWSPQRADRQMTQPPHQHVTYRVRRSPANRKRAEGKGHVHTDWITSASSCPRNRPLMSLSVSEILSLRAITSFARVSTIFAIANSPDAAVCCRSAASTALVARAWAPRTLRLSKAVASRGDFCLAAVWSVVLGVGVSALGVSAGNCLIWGRGCPVVGCQCGAGAGGFRFCWRGGRLLRGCGRSRRDGRLGWWG